MRQITQNYRTGELKMDEVPAPMLRSGGLLVENCFSLISSGTERSTIEVSRKGLIGKARSKPEQFQKVMKAVKMNGLMATYRTVMDRMDQPVPLGYSSAGIVKEVAEDASTFREGDRVACAGSGYASHAEIVFVPKNLCARVPEGVSLEEAAFTTVGAIAMHGVRQAQVQIGECIAVIGLGLVGLLTIQILKASGCSILGVDVDAAKLRIASDLSADVVAVPGVDNTEGIVLDFSNGRGVDAAIITAATSSSDPVILAGNILRDRGRAVIVGNTGIDIPRKIYYEKELDLRLSRSYGPGRYDPLYEEKGIDYPIGYVRWTEKRNMEAFLDLLAKGKVNVDKLTTHNFRIAEAEKAYAVIMGETEEPFIGVLLNYEGNVDGRSKIFLADQEEKVHSPEATETRVGVVGAGNFCRSFLLPNLTDNRSVILTGVATGTGINAKHVARKFGFQYCTADYQQILDDPETTAVVVATRHNLHAKVVIEAVKKNKAVFVEKPLALNESELAEVFKAWKENEAQIMVGFNRRFSSLTEDVRHFFNNRSQPLVINYRINAGYIPKDHWIQDADEGGGRIIGEVCHFADLAQFIIGSHPVRIFAESISANNDDIIDKDNTSISIKFADGSLSTIIYLANGDTRLPKERIEIFSEGSIAIIDDFKKLELLRNGKIRTIRKRRQDKGHREELQMFINALRNGYQIPIPFKESLTATIITFMIERSLREGKPMDMISEYLNL